MCFLTKLNIIPSYHIICHNCRCYGSGTKWKVVQIRVHIYRRDCTGQGGGHVPPTYTNGWARGAPWVEEQQTRKWPKKWHNNKHFPALRRTCAPSPGAPTFKFVPAPLCISTNRQNTKSNPNPNHTATQCAIVCIQPPVLRSTYPPKMHKTDCMPFTWKKAAFWRKKILTQ